MSPLGSISAIPSIPAPASGARPASGGGQFSSLLASAVNNVEKMQASAAKSVESLLSGEGGELHTTILEAQQAETSMELFLQMRNKVVQAYQEVMRMQL